jgi:hypothetical protein
VGFAQWYTKKQQDSFVYRLPTEQEWEYARKLGLSTIFFGPREHVSDWHNVYPNPSEASSLASPSTYAGPANGILRVVRDGASGPTTRHSVCPDATHVDFGDGVPATTFRLVKVATGGGATGSATATASAIATAAGASADATSSASSTPHYSPGSFTQLGIIPDGLVSVTAASVATAATDAGIIEEVARAEVEVEVDVSKLGPPEDVPLFDVRMVLPVPPDSELEGILV